MKKRYMVIAFVGALFSLTSIAISFAALGPGEGFVLGRSPDQRVFTPTTDTVDRPPAVTPAAPTTLPPGNGSGDNPASSPGTPTSRPPAGGAGNPPPTSTPPAQPSDTVREPAPIEDADVRIAESYPPQYFVYVRYGLPSGCAKPGGYEVSRQGSRIDLTVYYARPADPNIVCTMIYGTAEENVPLGSDFTPGETYTAVVNNAKTVTFTAQ